MYETYYNGETARGDYDGAVRGDHLYKVGDWIGVQLTLDSSGAMRATTYDIVNTEDVYLRPVYPYSYGAAAAVHGYRSLRGINSAMPGMYDYIVFVDTFPEWRDFERDLPRDRPF